MLQRRPCVALGPISSDGCESSTPRPALLPLLPLLPPITPFPAQPLFRFPPCARRMSVVVSVFARRMWECGACVSRHECNPLHGSGAMCECALAQDIARATVVCDMRGGTLAVQLVP
jgi:hypothetical protein